MVVVLLAAKFKPLPKEEAAGQMVNAQPGWDKGPHQHQTSFDKICRVHKKHRSYSARRARYL